MSYWNLIEDGLDKADLLNIDSQRGYKKFDNDKPILSLSKKITQKGVFQNFLNYRKFEAAMH